MRKLFICVSVCFFSIAARADLLSQLKSLAEINSETGQSEGISKTQEWIAAELKTLGFQVDIDKNGLLVADRAGNKSETITLLVHVDTVFPGKPVFVEGDHLRGSGVIDAKGGVVVALEGLRRFLTKQKSKYGIRFVSSPEEETGSSKHLASFRELSRKTWLVLGFEPALDDGSIVTSRRGNRWYKINVQGKEAHAGRAHRDGVNACHDLSLKIGKLSKLTDYAKDVTVSIGHFEGGKNKYNVVCGQAEAKVDVRFSTLKDSSQIKSKVEKILTSVDVKGAVTTFEIVDDLPPFGELKTAKKTVDLYLKSVNEVEGTVVKAMKSGGGADSNYFARDGVIVIDGLGPHGGKMHTAEEFLYLPSLETRAEALARFLKKLDSRVARDRGHRARSAIPFKSPEVNDTQAESKDFP